MLAILDHQREESQEFTVDCNKRALPPILLKIECSRPSHELLALKLLMNQTMQTRNKLLLKMNFIQAYVINF